MTATDVPVSRPLPMTEFLIANDVPKQYRTAACAAFALWLEQLGDGNAPLAVLHLAEALKREEERAAALSKRVDEARPRLAAACAKVHAVELLHVWTNEDGRRFVFADDLAVALDIPGAALSGGVV